MTIRALTHDYYSGDEGGKQTSEFYTTTQLGPKQSITPEGFLLCEDVPLARAGEMIYGPNETPIDAGKDGLVHISRSLEDLFHPDTIASFNGKPVTNEHPPEDVTPANWNRYAKGTMMNVRKGTGDNKDLLVGDLLITDPQTIQDIRNDKREVSLGYDADYTKTAEGRGRQSNILGNHVALVERGRCGPRCAINDHDSLTLEKENDMPQAINAGGTRRRYLDRSVVQRVLDNALLEMERMDGGPQKALSKDDAEGEYGKDLTGEGLQHIHIHLEGSTAPAGKTDAILMDGGDQTSDNFPGGPEFSPNPDAGNSPSRMQGQDDPTEMRFQRLESVLAQILQHLQGAGAAQQQQGGEPAGPGAEMGHGEPDGDEPGSANQAPGARMNDEEAEEVMEEAGTSATGDAAPLTRDQARKMRDSAPLEVSYRQLASDVEILSPGFKLTTFDSAVHPVDTIQFMCNTRKRVMDLAYMTTQGKQAIDQALRGRAYDSSVMDCKCLRRTFDSAVAVMRVMNNAPVLDAGHFNQTQDRFSQQLAGAPRDVQELGAFFKSHYKRGN